MTRQLVLQQAPAFPVRFLVLLMLFGLGNGVVNGTDQAPTPVLQAATPRYLIGLSPFFDKTVKDDLYRRIVGFLLEDAPLQSSLRIYDAYQLQTITQVEIPGVRAFRSAKTRANQFKEQIQKLKAFLALEQEPPSTSFFKLRDAIRFPQFMDFLSENLQAPGYSNVVVLLGNPLYLDPKEPGFSMVDGYFPSDGHLLASRDQSVYGIKDRSTALKDITVHFGYLGDPWVSEVHQEKIARFWALYLKGQGAYLATFCGDRATLFNAVRAGATGSAARSQRYELDQAQTKIAMLRLTRNVGLADWITRDVLSNIANGSPAITVGPMKIGIRWQGDIDLDLYATPHRQAETLYFEHPRSREGYYFKDYRSSPQREYEFIEFEIPVDLWQVRARVNFYEGETPAGAAGEIRIEFDGKIYSGPFSISAHHGNKGRSGRSQSEFWTTIDIPKILKLPEVPRNSAYSSRP